MNLRTSTLIAVGTAAMLAGSLAPAQQSLQSGEQLANALAGRAAGSPVSCIPNRARMQVVDDWTILFRDNSTLYLQKPRGGCPGLANDMTLVRNQFGTGRRLCSGDLNRVVNPRTGFDTGSCVYSDFVPYRKLR